MFGRWIGFGFVCWFLVDLVWVLVGLGVGVGLLLSCLFAVGLGVLLCIDFGWLGGLLMLLI